MTLVRYPGLEEIWLRLKEAFGDTELLLKNKLNEIEKLGPIWRLKDRQKLVQVLSKLSFVMTELKSLAEKYDIENYLYYGGGLQKVYEVIGYNYRDKFIRSQRDSKLSPKEDWDKFIKFINDELKVEERINLVDKA